LRITFFRATCEIPRPWNKSLQARFGLRRVVLVGDRGTATSENLEPLRSGEQGYLLGLHRRRRTEVVRYLELASAPWLECPVGIVRVTVSPRIQVANDLASIP
jgi:hypothetical protein